MPDSREAERLNAIDSIIDRCVSLNSVAGDRARLRVFASRVLDALSAAGFAVVPREALATVQWQWRRHARDAWYPAMTENDARIHKGDYLDGEIRTLSLAASSADLARPIADPGPSSVEGE